MTNRRSRMWTVLGAGLALMLLTAATPTMAQYQPFDHGVVVNGKGGGGNGGGGGGGGGGGETCPPAASRLAYASPLTADGELWAVNPDGTCAVQLTEGTGAARYVKAWTADDHIVVHSLGGDVTVLHVPDSSDPASVSIAAGPWTPAYPNSGGDVSQHTDASGVLPAMSQLMVQYYGPAEDNVYVSTLDGAWSLQLTNHVDDHQDGDGTEFRVESARWLASSADHSRARIWYAMRVIEYAGGQWVSGEMQHRVLSLDTTGWPNVSTANMTDKPLIGGDALIDGYPLSDLIGFSRDGSKAGQPWPNAPEMMILDLSYDDTLDEVTIHTESPLHTAADMVSTSPGVTFSPDGSTMMFAGAQETAKGRKVTRVHGQYTTSTSAAGPSTYVADITAPVWGP